VWGWSKGRWTLRSTHNSWSDAAEHAEALHHRSRIRTKVIEATTKRAVPTQAPAPTAAQRFREEQFDSMFRRQQAFSYYKSGLSAHPQPVDASGNG